MKAHPGGVYWEWLAQRYLVREGLRVMARNFHCRLGEIDLIMTDGESTVFVEVRYRRSDQHGSALDSVTAEKQLRISRAAGIFLKQHPRLANGPCRFDVVAISGQRHRPELRWVRNAFEA